MNAVGGPLSIECRTFDFADSSERIVKLLHRHLDDEEEIVVPIMLDRGELALMGG